MCRWQTGCPRPCGEAVWRTPTSPNEMSSGEPLPTCQCLHALPFSSLVKSRTKSEIRMSPDDNTTSARYFARSLVHSLEAPLSLT